MQCLKCSRDLSRGQAKFCSLSCATSYRNSLNAKPPIKCLQCQQETRNPKFCSSRCSATYHNQKQKRLCKSCQRTISIGWTNRRYCDDCRFTNRHPNYRDWSKITYKDFKSKLPLFQAHARIRELARRAYKRAGKPQHCIRCPYRNHFEVCHIKPINAFTNDTSIAIINHPDNLIGLCPNCHWDLDHGLIGVGTAELRMSPPLS